MKHQTFLFHLINFFSKAFTGISIFLMLFVVLSAHAFGNSSTVQQTTQDTIHISVKKGWNLVCLPLDVPDKSVAAVYPSAVSQAFTFNNGYIHSDSLLPGLGYWLKFDSSEVFTIIGNPHSEFTAPLHNGWNLIGSSTEAFALGQLDVDSCNASFTLPLYTYDPETGYSQSDTIMPGKGMWIKSNAEGLLYEKKWIKVTDIPFSSVTPHPTQPNIMFASLWGDYFYESVVMKSSDYGITWDTLVGNADTASWGILLDPSNPDIMYVSIQINGQTTGILKSTNSGSSWFRADAGIPNSNARAGLLAIDPVNTNVLYATAGEFMWPYRTYKSTDGGESWNDLLIHRATNCVIDTNYYVEGGLQRLAIDPQNSKVLYGGGGVQFSSSNPYALYWSSNGGETWDIRFCGSSGTQSMINTIFVDPVDSNRILLSANGVYASTDRGITWSELNNGLNDIQDGVLLFPTANPLIMYAWSSYCLYRTVDGGSSWEKAQCGTPTWNLVKIDQFIYALTNEGIYRTRICTTLNN